MASLMGGKWTKRVAQNMQPVRNLHDALIEIIKYGSKIFTEPEVDKKAKLKTDTKIYAGGLYQIFDSMKGLRIFERFGFNLPAGCRKKPTGARVIQEFEEWIYSPQYRDWLHGQNELVLSAYDPGDELIKLIRDKIDIIQE